ncbi:hypothetical protein M231_07602 [Tremella mesenterica]|uniref:Uncharacterized protein n=1 Tax=Tremella mesenterica TaxID=5217 RepID=A0A4Q1BBV6_TREME|nr:hypothetical protein M231_07602 [Tremella mesenterica]
MSLQWDEEGLEYFLQLDRTGDEGALEVSIQRNHMSSAKRLKSDIPKDMITVALTLFRYNPNGNGSEEESKEMVRNLMSKLIPSIDQLIQHTGLKERLVTGGSTSLEATRGLYIASLLMQLTDDGFPGLVWTSPPKFPKVQEVVENESGDLNTNRQAPEASEAVDQPPRLPMLLPYKHS